MKKNKTDNFETSTGFSSKYNTTGLESRTVKIVTHEEPTVAKERKYMRGRCKEGRVFISSNGCLSLFPQPQMHSTFRTFHRPVIKRHGAPVPAKIRAQTRYMNRHCMLMYFGSRGNTVLRTVIFVSHPAVPIFYRSTTSGEN